MPFSSKFLKLRFLWLLFNILLDHQTYEQTHQYVCTNIDEEREKTKKNKRKEKNAMWIMYNDLLARKLTNQTCEVVECHKTNTDEYIGSFFVNCIHRSLFNSFVVCLCDNLISKTKNIEVLLFLSLVLFGFWFESIATPTDQCDFVILTETNWK